MQFLNLEVGDVNLVFPERVSITVDFSFPAPAQSVRAMLQGFDLRFEAPDHQLKDISVALTTHHGPGDSAGTVDIGFALQDAEIGFDPINGQVKVLIVGN